MPLTRRSVLVCAAGAICSVGGCTEFVSSDGDPSPGSLTVANDGTLPQTVHVRAVEYPSVVPSPETRLSTSVYVEPGDSKYFEEYVRFPGEYGFVGELDSGDRAQVGVDAGSVSYDGEEGDLDGPAIEFYVQRDGSLGWSLSTS